MELGYLGSVQTTTVGAICQVLLYCTLACNARVVGLTQRHPIGQELLQVLSGRNISDAARVRLSAKGVSMKRYSISRDHECL